MEIPCFRLGIGISGRPQSLSESLCLGRVHDLPLLHRCGRGDKAFTKLQRKLIHPNTKNTPFLMNKILSTILLAVVALTFGCGKSETYQSPDGKVTIEQKGDSAKYEVTTKEGKATMTASDTGVVIPDTFPKDVPIPKGAVAKLTMSQGKTEVLHLYTPGAVADVFKEYQDKLKGEGWEIESSMNMEEGSVLNAKKGTRKCMAMLTKENAGTLIQLNVNQE